MIMNDIVNHIKAEIRRLALGNEQVVREYESLIADYFANEDDFVIIQWPEVQCLMEEEGFQENSILVNDDWALDKYGDQSYLINKQWLNKIQYGESF